MKKHLAIGVAMAVAGYAWMDAGVRPFSLLSYVLVAIPTVVILGSYCALGGSSARRVDVSSFYRRNARGASLRSVAPWLVVLAAVVALESVGLALGGRSPSVPTLSTTVDRLLVARWERWLLCVVWMLAGMTPVLRLRRFIGGKGP